MIQSVKKYHKTSFLSLRLISPKHLYSSSTEINQQGEWIEQEQEQVIQQQNISRPRWRLQKKDEPFRLTDSFLQKYSTKQAPFGFNGLGEVVYYRTYSRRKDDGSKEEWWETVARVVNGTYSMQKRWIEQHSLGWDKYKAQISAQKMFDKIFNMKFLPPGRGLWAMGSPLTEERGIYAALNNCAFVSTQNMWDASSTPSKPFAFLMDASMLGVGVGFDTLGANGDHRSTVFGPDASKKQIVFEIPDSREGWVDSVKMLIDSYFLKSPEVVFNYEKIRPAGSIIKGFGGVSSGPGCLMELHQNLREVLDNNKLKPLSITSIVDIMNLIGKCVVSGNIRRCLPGDSLVHTQKGLIPIKDIQIGDMVLVSTGDYQKVVNWFDQGVRDDMIKITTELGEFICTSNHRMPVLHQNVQDRFIWTQAQDLQSGDFLVVSQCSIPGCNTSLPPPPSQILCNNLPELDADLAWCIGFVTYSQLFMYNGDLFISGCINSYTQSIIRRMSLQLERFGIPFCIKTTDNSQRASSIVIQSPQILDLFSLIQYLKSLQDHPCILQSHVIIRTSFVSGAFQSSNNSSDSDQLQITSSKENLVIFQRILFSIGIVSKLTLSHDCLYSLYPHGPTSHTVIERITQLHNVNSAIISNPPEQIWYGCKILSIDYLNEAEHCYDIQVGEAFSPEEIGNHEYFVNGYLSHNTAEISFGNPNSEEYIDLKNYKKNPRRASFGWTSNNSVFCETGMDYSDICERVIDNGEPGFAWLENARAYGRFADPINYKDRRAGGGNPCLEQTLESYELCCLVETFPHNHSSLEEFSETLVYAYLYAKTVTLGSTHWPDTNRVTLRNRRIGCSMSGIAQFIEQRGLDELKKWCEKGYETIQQADNETSDWLAIPRSIKTTSIKPSGTVSLLAGATPGMHYPENRFCIRRVRLGKDSDLVDPLIKAGYKVEPCVGDESNTVVAEFPIDFGEGVRDLQDLSMWEQLSLAAFLQKYWSDNQVSCTVTFDPKTEGPHLKHALDYFQYQLKGISFLPRLPLGAYPQMPVEAITEQEYKELSSKIDKRSILEIKGKPIVLADEEMKIEKYCDGDHCAI